MGNDLPFQRAQKKLHSKGKSKPSNAPLKPAASSLRTLSSGTLPLGKHSLQLKNTVKALGSRDYSRETSPEPTISAATLRCGSAILHPGKKPLKGKINNRLVAKQRSHHIRKGSRSDDEKASHNAGSGTSQKPIKP